MKTEDICAVIISFNGIDKILNTIDALVNQVGFIYIVDNGSDQIILEVIEKHTFLYDNVFLFKINENMGIGKALNIGLHEAKKLNCKWLLTMDQDSISNENMIFEFQKSSKENPSIMCFTPNININNNNENKSNAFVDYAITSGNLINIKVFDIIGLYNEELFIDNVDIEFSLRLKASDIKMLRVSNAGMQHELGDSVNYPKLISKFYAKHSALRRYYMTRNLFFLIKKYLSKYPLFIIKLSILQVILYLLILFFDDSPKKSLYFSYLGFKDFLLSRYGKFKYEN